MGFFFSSLMKWREPKIKMVTLKNILTTFTLIFVVAIPFGFIGGSGRFFSSGHFSIFAYLLGLAFLFIAVIVLSVDSISPSSAQIQLREDAIVRSAGRRKEKSAYKDIQCIYFSRNCSASMKADGMIEIKHSRSVEGPNFTRFDVVSKSSGTFLSSNVTYFAAPDSVNLEQVLQFLREKGVNVIEGELPS